MVAATPDDTGDQFDGQPDIVVNLPMDGQQSGAFPVQESDGLTEQHLPPMPSPSGPMPSYTPAAAQPTLLDDPKAQEILGTMNRMNYEHQLKISETGQQPEYKPGLVDIAGFVRAQARMLREKVQFQSNAGRRDISANEYIDLLNRHSYEQDRFIMAQQELLHQLGIV